MTTAAAGALERLKLYVGRNEREVAVAFFAAGFLFDIVTVGRIDSLRIIAQQCIYLAVITAVLLHMLLEQGEAPRELAGLSRLARGYYEYRAPATHFALGALMNLYAIFFFKSSSLLVSFGFLGFLVVLLVANESRRVKAAGLHVKFALLGLCYLSFAAIVVPIAVGSIGTGVFLASMLAGAIPLALVVVGVRRLRPASFGAARRQILLPLGVMLVAFLAAYLVRVIPPAPLSIPFIGVYHSVERTTEGEYHLGHERPWWRFWHHGDQRFRAQPGDRVHVFFRVFSPARFADRVQMRWYWKHGERGWLLHDTIPIDIVGGREQGFRGFGFKANYQPGRWKVRVETMDSREIGRVYFTLENVPPGPRELRIDVQ